MNITAQGKTHLGAVIRSTEHRDGYVKDLVKDWDNQLTILSTISETQSQAAHLPGGLKANLKLVSATFYQIFISHQIIALQKL